MCLIADHSIPSAAEVRLAGHADLLGWACDGEATSVGEEENCEFLGYSDETVASTESEELAGWKFEKEHDKQYRSSNSELKKI